jgi:hypothetical protein
MNKLVWLSALLLSASAVTARADSNPLKVDIRWEEVTSVSNSRVPFSLGPSPKAPQCTLRHGLIARVPADCVHYVPRYPSPDRAFAELYPPQDGKTSGNCSFLDPPLEEFLNATAGHPSIMNFSTIPEWMFKIEKPVDPRTAGFDCEQGNKLRVSSKALGDY